MQPGGVRGGQQLQETNSLVLETKSTACWQQEKEFWRLGIEDSLAGHSGRLSYSIILMCACMNFCMKLQECWMPQSQTVLFKHHVGKQSYKQQSQRWSDRLSQKSSHTTRYSSMSGADVHSNLYMFHLFVACRNPIGMTSSSSDPSSSYTLHTAVAIKVDIHQWLPHVVLSTTTAGK